MSLYLKIMIGLIVVLALAIIGVLAAPLFYDVEVNEAEPSPIVPALTQQQVTASPSTPTPPARTGSFVGADSFHEASGTAAVLTAAEGMYIRFTEDFNVTNGPDLFVYLGKDGQYDPNANLGALKGNVGAQNYLVPETIDLNQYNEVWVWCRAFSQPFGHAVLR